MDMDMGMNVAVGIGRLPWRSRASAAPGGTLWPRLHAATPAGSARRPRPQATPAQRAEFDAACLFWSGLLLPELEVIVKMATTPMPAAEAVAAAVDSKQVEYLKGWLTNSILETINI